MKITMTALAAATMLLSQAAFAAPYRHHSYWHHRAYYRPHEVHCRYAGYAHGRRVYECHY